MDLQKSKSQLVPSLTVVAVMVLMTSTTVTSGSIDDLTIHTTHGDVRGQVMSVLDRQVAVFWGIPYARIPARFRPPERAEAWQETLDASTPPPSCPEVPYTLDISFYPPPSTPFDENCLYLNLWVPLGCVDKSSEDGLALMVWIHGGALEYGSSTVSSYNGQVLAATQCVIMASINYRLGVLGFLSLGMPAAPGNVGLLDQVRALQWIYENARNFGASPERITLFGESAGGLSIGVLMESPLSKHLFSRAIIQSEPVTSAFGKTTVSQNADHARKLASIMGCPVSDDDAIIRCLSEADSTELGQAASDRKSFPFPAFGIIVDNHLLTQPLIPSTVATNTRKINVMIGSTRDDGSFVFPLITAKTMNESRRPLMDQSMFYEALRKYVFPTLLHPPQHENLLIKLVEYIYVDSSLPEERNDYHTALEKIFSDLNFICPMYTSVAHLLDTSDVYMYSFDHRSSVSPFPAWMGVMHASEIDFVFGRPLDQRPLFSEEERQLSVLVMKAWANFAKSGNPSSDTDPSQWPRLNSATYPYVVIGGPQGLTVEQGLRFRECAFWNQAYTALVNGPGTAGEKHEDGETHDEL